MSGKTILFISPGADATPTRYRAMAYFDRLTKAGFEPVHIAADAGPVSRWAMLKAARKAYLVVVVRKMFAASLRWPLRMASKRLVLDFDDAIFLRDDSSPSRTGARRFKAMTKRVDAVWAGNDYLAAAARRYCQIVQVIPTAIDVDAYNFFAPKPDDSIDLVWIGTRSTSKYLRQAMPVLEEAAKHNPRLRLKIISDFELRSPVLRTVAIPWHPDTEAIELATSHIGISPLPEDSWTRGKCGLKMIQYMASGLPTIASRVGVHNQIVEHGRTGFLCERQDEWATAIGRLAADMDLRVRFGEAGRERIAKEYSLSANSVKLLRAIEMLE